MRGLFLFAFFALISEACSPHVREDLNSALNLNLENYDIYNIKDDVVRVRSDYYHPYYWLVVFDTDTLEYVRLTKDLGLYSYNADSLSGHFYLSDLSNKEFLWNMRIENKINLPGWWKLPENISDTLVSAGYYNDDPVRIGNKDCFNGTICSVYNAGKCYLIIECTKESTCE